MGGREFNPEVSAMSEASTVAQTGLSDSNAPSGDRMVIDGVSLDLDEIIDPAFLAPKRVKAQHETFLAARPFPHIVFEGLFSARLLELMYADFDRLNWSDWRRYDNANELKRGSAPKTRLGHASQLYFNTIHSGQFIDFIERVTGIEGLVPDPELFAGGLHDIPTGGKFAMHVDFNQHAVTKLDNRLVFITYLNKEWLPSYGGGLELWDVAEKRPVTEILPEFGRSVLFYQSSKSLHGHPHPVAAPNGRPRRSAAAYFYSNGRSDGDNPDFHTTQFVKTIAPPMREKLANALKYLLPPIVLDGVRRAKSLLP
jgi:Rps23 Pro-64 3,4-dihydroxylase Tpa1-like proline 4-hydroxylase